MRAYAIVIDGQERGRVQAAKTEVVSVAAGTHVVRMKIDWCHSPDLEVVVPDGGDVHLSCRSHRGFWFNVVPVALTALRGRYIDLE